MGLDFYYVYLELEEEFNIQFLDEVQSVPAETVGELFDVILRSLHSQRPERFSGDADFASSVWERYVTFLVEQLGVDRGQIVPAAYFVRDLKVY